MVFLVFINWVIVILYSDKFIAVNNYVHWAALGMLFKAASWALGYILLAKSKSKLFFGSELIANTYVLVLNLAGYYYLGLTGLGISFMLGYLIYLIQMYFICSTKYQFSFSTAFIKIFGIQLLLAGSCFAVVNLMENPYSYTIGVILIIASIWFSLNELDKRLGLKHGFVEFKSRYFHR
jgi:O-antigen/teichoic acid export membrane protein